jgi:hypothetical protein
MNDPTQPNQAKGTVAFRHLEADYAIVWKLDAET